MEKATACSKFDVPTNIIEINRVIEDKGLYPEGCAYKKTSRSDSHEYNSMGANIEGTFNDSITTC